MMEIKTLENELKILEKANKYINKIKGDKK